jgi:hypothetical protein
VTHSGLKNRTVWCIYDEQRAQEQESFIIIQLGMRLGCMQYGCLHHTHTQPVSYDKLQAANRSVNCCKADCRN